ncbi:hypothetical protein E2C01_062886 [Portunus trituberculatus]|uniref:Uncharacterized protein n=1 Tax=Portunus trituberculatus TaxID=210409 RepID=A0A5B7HCC5_PORTR|nr:hypothetical protein [Portunus trituberculatus]
MILVALNCKHDTSQPGGGLAEPLTLQPGHSTPSLRRRQQGPLFPCLSPPNNTKDREKGSGRDRNKVSSLISLHISNQEHEGGETQEEGHDEEEEKEKEEEDVKEQEKEVLI